MSLWTPDGEVPVDRNRGASAPSSSPTSPPPSGSSAGRPPGGPTEAELAQLSPEERAQAEAMMAEMAEVQAQIANTPAAQLVANHVMGFYELAAIHLSQDPPHFDDATLAIDAMAASLDVVEGRLGQDGTVLREGLTQLQMAFVELRRRESENAAPS